MDNIDGGVRGGRDLAPRGITTMLGDRSDGHSANCRAQLVVNVCDSAGADGLTDLC